MRTLMFNVLRNWSVISGDVIPKKKIRIVLIRNTCWSRHTWFAFLCMISDYIYYKKVKPPLPIHSEFYIYGSTYNWINGNYFYLLPFLLSQLISQFSEEGFKLQNLWLNVLIIKKYTLHKNLVYHQRKFRNIN